MQKGWFVNEKGPFSSQQLRKMAETGEISSETPIRQAGTFDWIEAGELKGLFPGHQHSKRSDRQVESPRETSTYSLIPQEAPVNRTKRKAPQPGPNATLCVCCPKIERAVATTVIRIPMHKETTRSITKIYSTL